MYSSNSQEVRKKKQKEKKGTNKTKNKEGPNVSIITENANSMTI